VYISWGSRRPEAVVTLRRNSNPPLWHTVNAFSTCDNASGPAHPAVQGAPLRVKSRGAELPPFQEARKPKVRVAPAATDLL
jgi:hypothetical protein